MKSVNTILNIIGTLGNGGAERHLVFMCEYLNKSDFSSDVFALTRQGAVYENDLIDAGSNVYYGSESKYNFMEISLNLYRTILRGKYRIVHTYLPYSTFLGTAISQYCQIPSIITTVCALSLIHI